MLTSLNRIAGMPVIWQDRQIGCVERAIADTSARRLRGLVIRKGIGTARWLPAGSVRLIGRRCVLAGAKPEPLPDGLTDGAGKRRAVQRANASAGRAGNYAGAGLRASRPLRLHRFLSGNPRGKASWAGDGLRADDMGGISGAFQKGGMGMSAWKAAVAGAVGFAVGAGAMLMPGNQKMKKQVQKQVDKLSKMAKMW